MITVNFLAILLAVISTIIIGSFWYSPKTPTGKRWIEWTNLKINQKNSTKEMIYAFGGTILTSFLLAYIIAHVSNMSFQVLGGSQLSASLSTSFFMWLGIATPTIFSHESFENRPAKLTFLNIAHDLIKIMIIGLIIGLLGWK